VSEALETADSAYIAHALGVVARAKGMGEIARQTGLGRESLYKALREGGNPEFATVMKVMQALGLSMTAKPRGQLPRRVGRHRTGTDAQRRVRSSVVKVQASTVR
jgi:probable addiction module antidote protein